MEFWATFAAVLLGIVLTECVWWPGTVAMTRLRNRGGSLPPPTKGEPQHEGDT